MRPHDRTQHVVGIRNAFRPFAHGFRYRVLEGRGAGGHRMHLRAEQLHAVNVEGLALRILLAHKHLAFEAHQRGGGRCGDPVLARSRFGDHPRFAHLFGQQGLPEDVVDFMRAGVVQIFPL